jgi:hypothetical protein
MHGEMKEIRLRRIAWGLIAASLLIGFTTRLFCLCFRDIDFSSADEWRDSYVYVAMRHGSWPVLGPSSGMWWVTPRIAPWSLPPLYYYIVYPFTFFGYDFVWQALSSAIFSFLTIPLLIFSLYRFLDGLPHARRLFWAAVGGLWWSTMVNDIILGTRPWNPSPVPFFFLLFLLIAGAQLRKPTFGAAGTIAWVVLGFLLAVLVSLHGTTLFTMPIVFVLISGTFLARSPSSVRAMKLIVISCLSASFFLIPYWIGEIRNHWSNTSEMIGITTLFVGVTHFQERFINFLYSYVLLDGFHYFITPNIAIRSFGLLFLVTVIPLGLMRFRGDRSLLTVFVYAWIVFSCLSAEYPATEERYRSIIVMAPIFLTISTLAFLDISTVYAGCFGCLLMMGIMLSMLTNIAMERAHEGYRFGPTRLPAASDIAEALENTPSGASLCDNNPADRYIDEYITRRSLRFSQLCDTGQYEIVPNFVSPVWSGSDPGHDWSDWLGHLVILDPLPGPSFPAGTRARVVWRDEALRLVFLEECKGSFEPARLPLH